ncbi:hypothetical protein FXO38_22781 [Capsicum annuum]|nr:hypothetical protein FXO38_22781 [Capsicum annuum]
MLLPSKASFVEVAVSASVVGGVVELVVLWKRGIGERKEGNGSTLVCSSSVEALGWFDEEGVGECEATLVVPRLPAD